MLLKCQLDDGKKSINGVKMDEYGLRIIKFETFSTIDEISVLALQVQQVLYWSKQKTVTSTR